MAILRHSASFVGLASLLCASPALLAAAEPDIGVFTAVEGKVSVQHAQSPEVLPAKLRDTVLFKDLIETQEESRTKALLNDDSILTVGEHSRVEITEHLYDPNRSLRSVVVNLVQGRVRALVGKVFAGSGSKFEVHTPTAVAAARGTYFVVWHVNGASGIANIGSHGQVGFASGGQTVTVSPGSFSIAPPGGPPAPPAPLTGSNVPVQVRAAVQGTAVQDAPDSESPSRAAAASGGTAPVQSPSSNANVSAATSGAFSSTTSSTPTTGITPPAVTSGAASGGTSGGDTGSGSGDTGGSGGDTGGGSGDTGGGGSAPPTNRGLHLGQLGLQPGFGNPTPGNNIVPPAVISGAARGPSFTPPGQGGTPPGLSNRGGGNGNMGDNGMGGGKKP